MSADRKFYATQLTITILSEGAPWDGDLHWLSHDVIDGDYVGDMTDAKTIELTETEMAVALIDAGSDPDFFTIEVGDVKEPKKKTWVVTAEGTELE